MASLYDAEWASLAKPVLGMMAQAEPPAVHDVASRRQGMAALFGALITSLPTREDVTISTHEVVSYDGAKITVHHYKPPGLASAGPAIVHAHGGGMIAGDVPMFKPVMAAQAAEVGIHCFDVEYRLAPEHQHPALVEDTYAALAWVMAHAQELNVDPKRIALQGESAGGAIAAGVSLMARDRKLQPPVAKVVLTYPMLDYKNVKAVSPLLAKHLFWTVDSNITGWTALLGEERMASDSVDAYASPAHAKDLSELPPHYIDLGDLDLFRDEDLKYAARLMAADVPVELHVYPGVPHAFEAVASTASVSQLCASNKMRALKSI